MRVEVPEDLDGARADLIIARIGGMSRAAARLVIDGGGATVDGGAIRAKDRVAAGSVLEFEPPPPPEPLLPEEVPFGVVYEDDHLAVVDKPAGVVTHPGAGRRRGTLASGILHRWPQVEGVGEQDRWGIVHRLDRDTSGLLVVAFDDEALEGLRSALKRREVRRVYVALVHGTPEAPTGAIDAPIGRDPSNPTRRRVDPEGRPARTGYRLVTSYGATSLLEVELETGRTHQIRVHLASIGLPIAGDGAYGRAEGSPRTFLHAARLSFAHPVTGDRIEVESPLPPDLARVIAEASP